MEKSLSSLTKICSSCGQRKPISAFLQLAGPLGSTYGNICSSCRKSAGENEQIKEKEEGTTSTTGFKIDSKSKTHEDIDKKLLYKQTEDLYHKDRDKKAERQLTQEQKIETIAKNEKAHRQAFLKKGTFLDSTKKPQEVQPAFGSEQQTAKENKIDLTGPMLDTQIVKEKYKGSVFKQFKSWLGTSAPIVRAAEQASKAGTKAHEPVEKLSDYVNKTWGPGSKRR